MGSDVLKQIQLFHGRQFLQNFAEDASNFLQEPAPSIEDVPNSLKAVLKANLEAILRGRDMKPVAIKAYYLRGKKKGKRISPRNVAYLFELKADSPGPSIDVLEGIAAFLDVRPWTLLIDHERDREDILQRILVTPGVPDSDAKLAAWDASTKKPAKKKP